MRGYLFVRVFLYLVACNFFSPAYAQQPEQVEVTHCSGKVEVLLEGADEYTDAQDNMVLSAGDKIKTASGASAELSFNEANTNLARLDENTSVNISLTGDEKLEMTEGEVFSSISELPAGSAFEIRTPTAVSGARGTDWVTKVTEEGTDVEALESVPYVRNFESGGNLSKEITRIVPGQMTTVRKFQKPMAFRPIESIRKQKWQQVKKEVVQRGFEAVRKRQDMPPFNRKDFIDQIKQKGNLKRQDAQQMRNESGDKSRPQKGFRERGQDLRDPRGGPMGEKTRRMEQMGQQDVDQRRNDMKDNSGVLVSGEKERYLPNMEMDGRKPQNDFRARGQDLRDPAGSLPMGEKTRRMEQMGQDTGTGIKRFAEDKPNESRPGNREKSQLRKTGPQKMFKPAGSGRR